MATRGDQRGRALPRPGALGAAGLLLLAPAAAAQEPVVVSPRAQLRWIGLQDLQAAVELEYRRDVDEVDPAGGSKRRDVQDRVREIFELSGEAFVGHPNLLEIDFTTELWLTQRWLDLDSNATTDQVDETLLNWDVRGLFLREQNVPITVYSRQTTSDFDRQFGGTFESTLTETGVRLNIRDETFPTNLEAFHRRLRQEDSVGDLDFEIEQYTVQGDGRVDLGLSQRMWWDFAYDDVDESGMLRAAQSFDRLDANLRHTLDFGAEDQHSLRSTVSYFDETGDRDFRRLTVDERLRLEHSPSLISWYDYAFEDVERLGQEQRRHEGNVSFRHQLFDSLTTTGRAGAIAFDIPTDDFDSREYFAEVDTDYVKKVPPGRIYAGVDGSISRVDESDRGAPIFITDAVFTFDASGLIVINQENIDPASVVITDLSGLILFTEGADYTLLSLPDRLEIRRVPGGDIAPGQTVLIDFTVGPEPGGTTDTWGLGLDFRYTFEEGFLDGLSLYTRYFRQEEDRPAAQLVAGLPDNDFTDLTYGLEYETWKIYLRAEQQIRDSNVSPFDSTRLEARYTERFGRGSVLVLQALYQDLDRTDDDLRTRTTTLSAQWSQRITDELRGSLLVQWQNIDDDAGFDSQAFEQELDLVWRYRQTEIYAEVRNSYRDSDADDTLFQTFILGIRREF